MNQKINSRKNAKPGTKTGRKINGGIPGLQPSFPGQVVKQFKLESLPLLVTTTVTTGVIATAYSVQAANVQNFATRFGVLFEEYRIVRASFSLKCFSSTNPGLFTHWVDEKQVAAPTSAEALQKSMKSFSCASPSPHVIKWAAKDPLDLQYTDIGTTNVIPVTYKIYTDNANFGSSVVATAYGQITCDLIVQFRGYN